MTLALALAKRNIINNYITHNKIDLINSKMNKDKPKIKKKYFLKGIDIFQKTNQVVINFFDKSKI